MRSLALILLVALAIICTLARATAEATQDQEGVDESHTVELPTDDLESRLASAISQTASDGVLAGRQAHAAFCTCDQSMHGRAMCSTMKRQCRETFCNPICLGMAWSVELEVDCEAAPTWKFCPLFKQQVAEASKAITAQFQAHICMQARFCKRTSTLVDWVENHTYGHKYPQHMLPIDTCLPHLHELHPAIAASTCKACSNIVTAKIRRGTCVPGFTPGYEVQEMSTLQERCEFVADYVSTHAHSLLLELQRSVCTCLGCCDARTSNGGRECYFPNAEKQWLRALIDRVSTGVTSKIHAEKKQQHQQQQKQAATQKRPHARQREKMPVDFNPYLKSEL